MTPHYLPSTDFILKNATASPEFSTAMFAGSILAVLGLSFVLLYRRYPQVMVRIAKQLQYWVYPRGFRHEARLERIICMRCNKGMGVYDPVYVTYQGESYIEGICSCCGQFVRARLR